MLNYKIKNYKIKNFPKGFTLIEVLVSVGLFLLTIMAISQIFITVIRSEKVAYALLNSENNIRNNLEMMAKTIRMGKNFNLSPDNQELCFDYYLDDKWQQLCYKFDDSSQIVLRSLDGSGYAPLLDPQIKLISGQFYQIGDVSASSQLSFIIQLETQVDVRGVNYPFHIETAVTSRYLSS